MKEVDLDLELERYELFAEPFYNFTFDRRQFLKVFSGGIALLVPASNLLAQEQGESGGRGLDQRLPNDVGAWIHIDENGVVSVFTGKVELGQNIRTSLAQAVAEELHVPVNTIRLVMADTDLVPYDFGTAGSMTTRMMSPQLRKAAATLRELLLDLAARGEVLDDNLYTTPGRFGGGGAGTTWLVGSAEDVAKSLRRYQALGVTHFVLSDTPYLPEIKRQGDLLLPLLRE